MDNYATNPVSPGPQDLSSTYLGTEPRPYSEPRATHLPHWADVRHSSSRSYSSSNLGIANYGSSQSQMPAFPRNTTGNMGYDTYPTLRQPVKRHDLLLGNVLGPSLLEAQEGLQYGGADLNYDYAGTATSECPLSSSSDSSGIEYHPNSALSSSTTTPPFYPLDTLEISSSDGQSRPIANNFNNDIRKRVYAEEDAAGLLHFSYSNKDPAIRDDWCVDSNADKVVPIAGGSHNAGHGEQQSKNLPGEPPWQNDVRRMEMAFGYQVAGRGDSSHCAT
ncbi:hypothetical protein P691DRAFT_806759 [Macrolepiota fuliginosa MF-IS2]|uniref:Uncharacterized protein n=1 Tax=Macrolepiota fuliginosa MF-IS2 TaxID=1400762 RepID=A0A9P6CB06_9AGAR|nr:hypothetical protein P691DRAFT_806759 [Macrolepiota fuliginosa MF-IS2]